MINVSFLRRLDQNYRSATAPLVGFFSFVCLVQFVSQIVGGYVGSFQDAILKASQLHHL